MEDGHGTHCAGTIFGRNVDGTRIGVAPGINRVSRRKGAWKGWWRQRSDRASDSIWVATNGSNVISMSLGIDFPGYENQSTRDTEGFPTELATLSALEGYRANVLLFERFASFIAAQSAFRQATLLVAAAGNESRRELNPDFEIAAGPPAVADGIISVAGVAPSPQGFTVASFSNVGARVSGPVWLCTLQDLVADLSRRAARARRHSTWRASQRYGHRSYR